MAQMRISTQSFHVPKLGNAPEEYEDAFFPDSFTDRVDGFRCAVADGASESVFAKNWAQALVRSFSAREMNLERLRDEWQKDVGSQRLPWFLEKKSRRGAFAAFVGLSLRTNSSARSRAKAARKPRTNATDWMPADSTGNGAAKKESGWHTEKATGKIAGTWRALAIGDSCLFQLRGDNLITVGPVSKSEEFDNSPFLLGSKSKDTIGRDGENVSLHSGTWSRGDRFYLATDALSQWLLLRHEAGMPPWEMLRELGAKDTRDFDELIGEMRADHDLHNDDTTLLRVEVT
jgi:hypothetical protein